MIKQIDDDILVAKEQYICHQCNCVSTNSAGLANLLFHKWPQANTYKDRTNPNTPGTISIHSINDNQYIVNMYAQYYPGFPNISDSSIKREKYFLDCLQSIISLKPTSIAFPHKIGCGLAGGNWERYYQMINSIDNSINIVIYKI